jgi:flagellar export protein FliJ
MSDYRYGRLMEVKERLLEQKQTELDGAVTALGAVIEQIEAVGHETGRTYDEMTARCLTGKELSVLVDYMAYLDMRKADLYNEKTRIRSRLEGIRKELCDLEVELKMLEKLKSKALQIIKKTRKKKEQKLMDELALRIEGL